MRKIIDTMLNYWFVCVVIINIIISGVLLLNNINIDGYLIMWIKQFLFIYLIILSYQIIDKPFAFVKVYYFIFFIIILFTLLFILKHGQLLTFLQGLK